MSSKMKNSQKVTLMKGRGAMMTLAFFLTITFHFFNSVNGCKVYVQQSKKLMRATEQQSISIPCTVNMSSCPHHNHQISWFVFKKDSHHQIYLTSQPLRYTLQHEDLRIESLSKADCGVYYCAAEALLKVTEDGTQAIGQGTTLKVSERGLTISQVLLVALLVLLTLYSLLILGLLICIKTGQCKSVFKRRLYKSESKEDFSKRVIFSGVVQELYKRNLTKRGKIQAHKIPQDKPEGLQNVQPNEDIYQNFDE